MLRRDDGDDMPVLGVEPAEEVEHLAGVVDRLADVAKSISELLEVPGVLGHVHVTLDKVAELGLQVDCPMELVVADWASITVQMM